MVIPLRLNQFLAQIPREFDHLVKPKSITLVYPMRKELLVQDHCWV
jgi:hypothetical protein